MTQALGLVLAGVLYGVSRCVKIVGCDRRSMHIANQLKYTPPIYHDSTLLCDASVFFVLPSLFFLFCHRGDFWGANVSS